jgi:hypothetical protein
MYRLQDQTVCRDEDANRMASRVLREVQCPHRISRVAAFIGLHVGQQLALLMQQKGDENFSLPLLRR